MLSLRRAICKALKVPHCSLMLLGYKKAERTMDFLIKKTMTPHKTDDLL
jgi:hypothetical protein